MAYDARMGRKDRFGRTLAYVVQEDGSVLNEQLVATGHGFTDPRFPFCWADEYRDQQQKAAAAGVALWTASAVAVRTKEAEERAAAGDLGSLEGVALSVGGGGGNAGSGGGSAAAASGGGGAGQVYVRPHTRGGTDVRGHYRNRPSR